MGCDHGRPVDRAADVEVERARGRRNRERRSEPGVVDGVVRDRPGRSPVRRLPVAGDDAVTPGSSPGFHVVPTVRRGRVADRDRATIEHPADLEDRDDRRAEANESGSTSVAC